jgi:oligoendopeptidase F
MKPCSDVFSPESGGYGVLPERRDVPLQDQWDTGVLYARPEDWETEFAALAGLLAPLLELRGNLDSAEALARFFRRETRLARSVEKLNLYARLKFDEDTAHEENQARIARMRQRLAQLASDCAWFEPELLSKDPATLEAWASSDALVANRYALTKILRRKPHTLSDREEALLSRASDLLSAPATTYSLLANADLRFPSIPVDGPEPVEVTPGRYLRLMMHPRREVRRDAFHAMHDTYAGVKNTVSSTLAATVRRHNFEASLRGFPSALAAALHEDQIPVAVYERLIGATRRALPAYHDYLALRGRTLKLDPLDMFDLSVPLVPDLDRKIPLETAKEWILRACEPLGGDYGRDLRRAFSERWIDLYENRGKRSGAYASGCYDSPPFILLNYNGTLTGVFTLAHELGHALHTVLSNRTQPPRFARYTIFVAEIASTLNEALLLRYLLETQSDPALRTYLLNHQCDQFKGTVYRQVQFAEFEKTVHELDAAEVPLTPALLFETYRDLNARYQGLGVRADACIGWEWARVPHFYYNFYVYKYATSFCASQILVEQVLAGQAERALDLFRAGASDDPLELVRRAGVDLAGDDALDRAFDGLATAVRRLSERL